MRTKFSKKFIEAIEPSQKDQLFWDTEVPGFGVKVTPKGKRVYFVYYRNQSGQQRRPKVGDHGSITLDEARKIARQQLAMVSSGIDVSAERQVKRSVGTVAELADRYLTEYAEAHKKRSSIKTDKANIENHVLPILGAMAVSDVTRQDIDRLKLAVRDGQTARKLPAKPRGRRIVRGGEGIANRVIALTSKMFACAQEWGLRSDNPAQGIRKFREHRKDRFLSSDEVGRLLTALREARQQQTESLPAIVAIRILLLTGMRCGEVLNLKWKEVDEANACFRLPDSKTGSRIIPYSRDVSDEIGLLERAGPEDLVFEGREKGSPLSLRRPWYRVRELANIDDSANLHSLRHTFASWSVMNGLSLTQVGALLGHKSSQTTLRYADHALEAQRGYFEKTGSVLTSMEGKRHSPPFESD
ncbi:tyrosine-type recombinase/integrase [Hoeflea alexandrii]